MLLCDLVPRRDSQQLHGPPLERVVQNLPVEVDVGLSVQLLLNLVRQIQRVLVREREREGEVSRLGLWIGEHVCELHGELLIVVEERVHLCHDSPPLLLVVRHHAEGRLQPLIVQLRLFKEST